MKIKIPNYISGPYAVGTETFSIIDEQRKEVLGPAKGPRKIAVRLYYPAEKEAVIDLPKAELMSALMRKAVAKTFFIKIQEGEKNTADFYANVPQAEGKKFPLVVFNHGYSSYKEGNSFLCCDLASNGYVVVSVGHAYEAIANEYDDGSYDLYDKSINKKMYDSILKTQIDMMKLEAMKGTEEEIYEKFDALQRTHMRFIMNRVPVWAQDTMCVVRELKKRYGDRIDFSKGIGATGHSMGGAVAYYLCHHEEEISCGVNIDGGIFGEYEGLIMKKPFLVINCRKNINATTRALFATEAFVKREVFEDMTHVAFSDMKFVIPFKAMVGKMDGVTMHKRLVACHLEIFDSYLK